MLEIFLILILFILITKFLFFDNTIEGLDNNETKAKSCDNQFKSYDNLQNSKDGAMFLAMQNAANIKVLHQEIGNLNSLKKQINENSKKIESNETLLKSIQKSVTALGKKLSSYTSSLYAKKPDK